jgi:hypothetical protein
LPARYQQQRKRSRLSRLRQKECSGHMYALILALAVALQSATVIDVERHTGSGIGTFTLAIRLGDMICAADFDSGGNIRDTDFVVGHRLRAAVVGHRLRAAVEHGKMIVRGRHGQLVTATIVRVQRVLLEPR